MALVSAAEAHFGSWGKALDASGIDPSLYFVHHKWRKSRAQALRYAALKKLLRINDRLFQLCKLLNEKRDTEISSRLIPLVDDLTHILIEAGKNKLH
jgi:hypothetical protein